MSEETLIPKSQKHVTNSSFEWFKNTLFSNYFQNITAFDEYFSSSGFARPETGALINFFSQISTDDLIQRQGFADNSFKTGGVTFTVYADNQGVEKIFPFDLIPRVIAKQEWEKLQAGLTQRIMALNAFLHDIYHEQRILKEKIIPQELVFSSSGYLKEVRGITPPGGVYIHVAGIDIIRDAAGNFLVLEDNLRTPSGVSYVLANRKISKQVLQSLLNQVHIQAVDQYPLQLRSSFYSLLPEHIHDPYAVVLTPGSANSAYFEHSFLAQQMGFELVEGQDLFVENQKVYAKTTRGAIQVHIIYRRVDDTFLDPEVFREDSLLGVPGLMQAYAAGNVILANAPGNGVADDKAIFTYVPDMIRFYLNETPKLPQVPTYLCTDQQNCQYVLQNLSQLVIKVTDGSGGYGMLLGPQAGTIERSRIARAIHENPRNFIAQPVIELSTCPTLIKNAQGNYCLEPRRVDLRPYCITGKNSWILPGGLTRVALQSGSYIVNSSQGGGSKDTWIMEDLHL